jgi:hypothetical protein
MIISSLFGLRSIPNRSDQSSVPHGASAGFRHAEDTKQYQQAEPSAPLVEPHDRWQELLLKEKQFTWPDKPILFDDLEELFLQAGLKSPLMYCHLSPGLLRVKAQRKRG